MKNQTLKGYFVVLFLLTIVFYGAMNQPICFADDNVANELLKISATPDRPPIDVALISKITTGMYYKQVMDICGNPHGIAVYGTNLIRKPKTVVFVYKTTQDNYAIDIKINGYVGSSSSSIRKLKRKLR
jgi:hypothetical protein